MPTAVPRGPVGRAHYCLTGWTHISSFKQGIQIALSNGFFPDLGGGIARSLGRNLLSVGSRPRQLLGRCPNQVYPYTDCGPACWVVWGELARNQFLPELEQFTIIYFCALNAPVEQNIIFKIYFFTFLRPLLRSVVIKHPVIHNKPILGLR